MIRILKRKENFKKDKCLIMLEVPSILDNKFIENTLNRGLDGIGDCNKPLTINQLIKKVKLKFKVEFQDLIYNKQFLLAKQILVYLCRENGHRFDDISKYILQHPPNKLSSLNAAIKRKLINNELSQYKYFIKTNS